MRSYLIQKERSWFQQVEMLLLKFGTSIMEQSNKLIHFFEINQINNYFFSGSSDGSIIMWKYYDNNEWKRSKPQNKHKKRIYCVILTENENQLISCSDDSSIKVWTVDFNNHESNFLYSLDKHTGSVYSLSLNQSLQLIQLINIRIWISCQVFKGRLILFGHHIKVIIFVYLNVKMVVYIKKIQRKSLIQKRQQRVYRFKWISNYLQQTQKYDMSKTCVSYLYTQIRK
ncbi:unnamed protein product [Paramecium sonneborni]|uniref:Uncharacterized protein n=1 Tax=Paramecium sonneborni TaxID=65129 RepID=A0A8S1RTF2_9CILI|nr:unnamed protein product [Paramecium sonneborni]